MTRDRRNKERLGSGGNVVSSLTCECGKRGYRDRESAKTVVQRMRRRGAERPEELNAYRCHLNTGCWHVGHRAPRWVGPDLNNPQTWAGDQ